MPTDWSYRDEHGRVVIDIDAAFDACDAERDAWEERVLSGIRASAVDVEAKEITEGDA